MNRTRTFILMLGLLPALAMAGRNQIAIVSSVKGKCYVRFKNSDPKLLQKNTPIFAGDQISVHAKGRLILQHRDGSSETFSPSKKWIVILRRPPKEELLLDIELSKVFHGAVKPKGDKLAYPTEGGEIPADGFFIQLPGEGYSGPASVTLAAGSHVVFHRTVQFHIGYCHDQGLNLAYSKIVGEAHLDVATASGKWSAKLHSLSNGDNQALHKQLSCWDSNTDPIFRAKQRAFVFALAHFEALGYEELRLAGVPQPKTRELPID